MCATSLNDDEFAHPVIFGVFEGGFCDMSLQKSAISPWSMLTFYQYVILKILPMSYFHEGNRTSLQGNSCTLPKKLGFIHPQVVHSVVFTTFLIVLGES